MADNLKSLTDCTVENESLFPFVARWLPDPAANNQSRSIVIGKRVEQYELLSAVVELLSIVDINHYHDHEDYKMYRFSLQSEILRKILDLTETCTP